MSIFEGLPQILTGRVQNDEQYGFGQDYLDLFVTKALWDISDINDHVISVATSIKYFRERRHERQKTPKIHQCRIVLKKFGQKFFQIVFLHGEVLFPPFFLCFLDALYKRNKNVKMLLDFKYFKFNFSVAGLKLQPFFQSSKWLKNSSDFCPKCRMGSRTKIIFHFFLAMIKYSSPSHLAHFW